MDLLMAAAAAPPASPWNAVTITTAVVASLGFLVAAGGLALGLYNARHQSRRDFPKPRWVTEWIRADDDLSVDFRFENSGGGDALDVELWVLAGKDRKTQKWVRAKGFGDMKFRATQHLRIVWSKPKTSVELRWKHRPNVHRLRTKRRSIRR